MPELGRAFQKKHKKLAKMKNCLYVPTVRGNDRKTIYVMLKKHPTANPGWGHIIWLAVALVCVELRLHSGWGGCNYNNKPYQKMELILLAPTTLSPTAGCAWVC